MLGICSANNQPPDSSSFSTHGPQGRKGPQGIPGIQGMRGQQGTQGLVGLKGSQGIAGSPTRILGPQGRDGHIGRHGTQGAHGGPGQHGKAGPQGKVNIGLQGENGTQGPKGQACFQSFGSLHVYERKSSLQDAISLQYNLPIGEHYLRFNCQINSPEFANHASEIHPCRITVTLQTAGITRKTSCGLKRVGVTKQLSIELSDVYLCSCDTANVLIEVESVFLHHLPIHISHCSMVVFSKELSH